jgi:hypothetical protein
VILHTHALYPHTVFALRTEQIYGCNESQNQFSSFEITIVVFPFRHFTLQATAYFVVLVKVYAWMSTESGHWSPTLQFPARLGTDNPPPSSVEVKNDMAILELFHYSLLHLQHITL